MKSKALRTVWLNVCALFFLGGCLRRTPQKVSQAVSQESEAYQVSEADLVGIPVPLVEDCFNDISGFRDRSVVTAYSLFSRTYLERFYETEMDRLGWTCAGSWVTSDGIRTLLYERATERIIIMLESAQNMRSKITLLRLEGTIDWF